MTIKQAFVLINQTIVIGEFMDVAVGFKKTDPEARVPTYGSKEAACFDFYTLEKTHFHANEKKLVRTGIILDIPQGYEVQIRPRSGISLKSPLRIPNAPGTIDSDYSGECFIMLHNMSSDEFTIDKYDRIAQGKLSLVYRANFYEINELKQTERGSGGMGSTGR